MLNRLGAFFSFKKKRDSKNARDGAGRGFKKKAIHPIGIIKRSLRVNLCTEKSQPINPKLIPVEDPEMLAQGFVWFPPAEKVDNLKNDL